MKGEWDEAAKWWYGFDSVDKLEEAWLAWLTKPESRLVVPRVESPKRSHEKPDLIPPTNLPDGAALPTGRP